MSVSILWRTIQAHHMCLISMQPETVTSSSRSTCNAGAEDARSFQLLRHNSQLRHLGWEVRRSWRKWLSRRSQRGWILWSAIRCHLSG